MKKLASIMLALSMVSSTLSLSVPVMGKELSVVNEEQLVEGELVEKPLEVEVQLDGEKEQPGEQLPEEGEQLPEEGEQLPEEGEQLQEEGEQLPEGEVQLPGGEEQKEEQLGEIDKENIEAQENLDKEIEKAQVLRAEDYTVPSWQALQEILVQVVSETQSRKLETKDLEELFIRLRTAIDGLQLQEVSNNNLALNKSIIAQYTHSDRFNASQMVDGLTTTRWASNSSDIQYIELDFGQEETFNTIVIREDLVPGYTDPRVQQYNFEYWDGTEWIKVYEGEGIGAKKENIFRTINTQKIKMNIITTLGDPTFTEFEVYNQKIQEADKAQLTAKVEAFQEFKEEEFTPESWMRFKNELTIAKEVLLDDFAIQEEVDNSIVKLDKAMQRLIKVQGYSRIYYIDSINGDDANEGTSENKAWKTLDKINSTVFGAGDQILFKSGGVWNGQLWPKGSGIEGNPIVIDKYDGEQLPIINGLGIDQKKGYTGTVLIRNQQYWEINNLEITNDNDFDIDITKTTYDENGNAKNLKDGILVILDSNDIEDGDDTIMDHIYINNCYIHDVDGPNEWNGSMTGAIVYKVTGAIKKSVKFNDVRVANNTIRKVDLLAIVNFNEMPLGGWQDLLGPNDLYMTNFYYGHNYMTDIGQGGIDICDVENAVVEYNVLDGFCKRYERVCAGIYPWKSSNVVFRFNEVFNGPTGNGDGTPWDLDSGLKDIVYEYNYSHNNPAGWMLYMGKNSNDIVRYNISDDGGEFLIKYFDWANSSPSYFLNNVLVYDSAKTTFMHERFFGSDTYFYNNIFYNKNREQTSRWLEPGATTLGKVNFDNNCFYEASGIHSPNEPKGNNNIQLGGENGPGLVNPGQEPLVNEYGILSGATIWDGYKLTADSPLIDAGIYVPQMGDEDFFGNKLYYGEAPDIGVHEYNDENSQEIPGIPVNVALNKNITAQYTHSEPFKASKMVDGNTGTRWASSSSSVQWIEIDLGQQEAINKIVIKEDLVPGYTDPRVQEYNFEYWDGTQWIKFYEGNGIGGRKEDKFETIRTQKIKMNILSTLDTPTFTEFEIYSIKK